MKVWRGFIVAIVVILAAVGVDSSVRVYSPDNLRRAFAGRSLLSVSRCDYPLQCGLFREGPTWHHLSSTPISKDIGWQGVLFCRVAVWLRESGEPDVR